MKKKISILLVMTLVITFFTTLFVSPAGANGIDYTMTTDLFADQEIDVGDLILTQTGNNLNVEIIMEGSWYLLETHIDVADDASGIYQKNGNPIPGKFSDKQTHDSEPTYETDFDVTGMSWPIIVAVHASVINDIPIISEIETYDWGRSTESEYDIESDTTLEGAVDAGFSLEIDNDQTVWNLDEYQGGGSTSTDEHYATWPQYYGGCNDNYEVRHFQASFDIPKEIDIDYIDNMKICSPYDADLIPINDNLYLKLNNNYIGERGTSYGATNGPASNIPYTDGWYADGDFTTTAIEHLEEGTNTLDLVAEEFCSWGGMSKLNVKIQWYRTESAWGAHEVGQKPFPGKNWATYLEFGEGSAVVGDITFGISGDRTARATFTANDIGSAGEDTGYLDFEIIEGGDIYYKIDVYSVNIVDNNAYIAGQVYDSNYFSIGQWIFVYLVDNSPDKWWANANTQTNVLNWVETGTGFSPNPSDVSSGDLTIYN